MNTKLIILITTLFFCNILFAGTSDMGVEISANATTMFAGERVLVSTSVTNHGSSDTSNVQLELSINSPNVVREFSINSQLDCQINSSTIVCSANSMSSGESQNINFSFIPTITDTTDYIIQIQANVSSSNSDDNQSNNHATQTIHVTSAPTQEQWGNALLNALGDDAPRLSQMVGALAAYCGANNNYFTGMAGNCDTMFIEALNGNGTIIRRVLRRLRPREVVQQARTSVEIIATQQANVASRMAQVRAGVTNSIAGLSISAGGNNLPIEMLGYLSDSDASYNQLVSPWGFFINGQITSGDYTYADARDEGFDFDTDGVTAGIDYRLSSKTIIGMAIGYANFDSTVGEDAKMQSSALTFSAYGSFNVTDNFYIDAKASFGNPEFDQQRTIQFTMMDRDTDKIAAGETEGTQQSIVFSSGYQFNKNGWQLTPSISAEYTKTTVDEFVETGAAAWNVGFSEQNFSTNRFTLGFQANKSISLSKGVLIPSVGYQLIHENQNGDNVILMRISGMPNGEFFEVGTDFNDGDYSTAQVGLTFVSSRGKQAYLQYSKVFGWDGFDRYTLNLGARFEF